MANGVLMWSIMDALLSVTSGGQLIAVKVEDISRSGMRVHADSCIARGTSVQVECEELVAEGVVWHSRRFRGAYSIGIEFRRIIRLNSKRIPSNLHTYLGRYESFESPLFVDRSGYGVSLEE